MIEESREQKRFNAKNGNTGYKDQGTTPKSPFENYIFTGDNWDGFIADIFTKVDVFSASFMEYHKNKILKTAGAGELVLKNFTEDWEV